MDFEKKRVNKFERVTFGFFWLIKVFNKLACVCLPSSNFWRGHESKVPNYDPVSVRLLINVDVLA